MKPNEPLVAALSDWIENHLDRDTVLPVIAARSGYSLWRMQNIFRDAAGMAVGYYIHERKLIEVIFRLQNSDGRILDVTISYGFNF